MVGFQIANPGLHIRLRQMATPQKIHWALLDSFTILHAVSKTVFGIALGPLKIKALTFWTTCHFHSEQGLQFPLLRVLLGGCWQDGALVLLGPIDSFVQPGPQCCPGLARTLRWGQSTWYLGYLNSKLLQNLEICSFNFVVVPMMGWDIVTILRKTQKLLTKR